MGPTRRIVMFNWVTADGYFAGRDGNLAWVVPDEAQAQAAVAGISDFDTVLFGRRTYELFEGFWRHAVDDSSTVPDPHHPGRRSREHRVIALWLNAIMKVVFSSTLQDASWKPARVLHTFDPREIATMKRQPGKDMIVFGSGSLVSQLTQHRLIDEYQFVVCPLLLGSGRPLLSGVSQHTKLALVEAKPYPSGDVLLRYARPNEIVL